LTAVLADDDGEGRRLHKTIRAEFLLEHDRRRESIEAVQAALDAWVVRYNTERPHQSGGGRPGGAVRAGRAEPARRRRAVTVPAPRPAELSRPAG
jgi:transposase InsO family protein